MLLASRRLQPCIFILPKASFPSSTPSPSRTQHAHHLFLLLHLLLTSLDPRRPRKKQQEGTRSKPQRPSLASLLQFLPPPPPCSSYTTTTHHPRRISSNTPASQPRPKPPPPSARSRLATASLGGGSYCFRLRDLPRPPFRSSNASRTHQQHQHQPVPISSSSSPLVRLYARLPCRFCRRPVPLPPFPFSPKGKPRRTHSRRVHAASPGVPAGHPRVLLIGPPYSTWWYCGPVPNGTSCRQLLLLPNLLNSACCCHCSRCSCWLVAAVRKRTRQGKASCQTQTRRDETRRRTAGRRIRAALRLHDVATPQNTTPGLFSIQGRRGCARNQTTDDLASSSATRSLLRHGEKGLAFACFCCSRCSSTLLLHPPRTPPPAAHRTTKTLTCRAPVEPRRRHSSQGRSCLGTEKPQKSLTAAVFAWAGCV